MQPRIDDFTGGPFEDFVDHLDRLSAAIELLEIRRQRMHAQERVGVVGTKLRFHNRQRLFNEA